MQEVTSDVRHLAAAAATLVDDEHAGGEEKPDRVVVNVVSTVGVTSFIFV